MSKQKAVIVIGAGMVGLWLTKLLADQKIDVVLIESNPPVLNWSEDDYTARVSALNADVVMQLQSCGLLLDASVRGVSPLRGMRVWDTASIDEMQFDAAHIGKPFLGYIVENRELVRQLWSSVQQDDRVTLLSPSQPIGLRQDGTGVVCQLQSGQVQGCLLVGCDGAQSWVRQQLGLRLDIRSYQQHALVSVIQAKQPHQGLAYQRFMKTGPLGLLPLHDGHQMSVVWSCDHSMADQLMALSRLQFNTKLTNALQCRLDKLETMTPVVSIPLVARRAQSAVSGRVVLQGDALQTIHPLAGQGANLGLKDAICLRDQIVAQRARFDRNDLSRILMGYQRRRQIDRQQFGLLMRVLCEGFAGQSLPETTLRAKGMTLINRFDCIKNQIMRTMIGADR